MEKKDPEFLTYFEKNWVNSHFFNWSRALIPAGFSHTNNFLDGFNNGIKSRYTEWELLKFDEFFHFIQEMIEDYSKKQQ